MCCLWGIIDYGDHLSRRQKSRLLTVLATESQARGTDATGVAYNSAGALHIFKRPVEPRKFHPIIPRDAQVLMGHTRMTTQGSEKKNHNNHPFLGELDGESFALAHNGVLHNDFALKHTHHLPTTKIETDSYVGVQLIEKQRTLSPDSLKFMAEQVEGSFVFTTLDEDNTISFVKGDNPLSIHHFPQLGLYLYASTEEILSKVIGRSWLRYEEFEVIETSGGDILQIDKFGRRQVSHFEMSDPWAKWDGRYSFYQPSFYLSGDAHVRELKAVAYSFGYTPEDIDKLLEEGFSPDEIEDALYYNVEAAEYAHCYQW